MGNENFSVIPAGELIFFMFFLLTGLTVVLLIDSYMQWNQKAVILTIIVLVASLIIQNYVDYRLATGMPWPRIRTVVGILGYIVRPVLLVLFLYLATDGKKIRLAWVLAGINAAVYLTALFSGVTFWISENNHFHRGPLGYTCHVITAFLLVASLYVTVRQYWHVNRKESLIPLFTSLMIIAAVLVDSTVLRHGNYPVACLTVAVVVSCVFYYIWLHLQFVHRHEEDLIAAQRMEIMVAQIQPHFLYNALSVIRSLCQKDAALAEDAVTQFTEYLRYNMDSLTTDKMIPFLQEMEHVKRYLQLQKLRFQEDLQVEYDLRCTEFDLPCLTVQPLVENAVTWGIRRSESGTGTIVIRSIETEAHYVISIIDDGIGFTPGEEGGSEERSHIGIENVRERLHSFCKGELHITTESGKGTTATILLPRDRED